MSFKLCLRGMRRFEGICSSCEVDIDQGDKIDSTLSDNVSSQLRKLVFKILCSRMILLLAWKACVKDLDLAVKIMPCNISTRWNSMYDMLSFGVEYQ